MGVLQHLFAVRGTPEHIRSNNGPELVSKVICRWLKAANVKTLFIAMGRPWENGYVESFNGTLRDELLNLGIFLSFEEACWVIDRWRLDYNHHRIRSSLDYQIPAAYAAGCVLPASATPQLQNTAALSTPALSLNLVQRLTGSQPTEKATSGQPTSQETRCEEVVSDYMPKVPKGTRLFIHAISIEMKYFMSGEICLSIMRDTDSLRV